jgi:hypothetical protein
MTRTDPVDEREAAALDAGRPGAVEAPGEPVPRRTVRQALADRWAATPGSSEAGMSTAEYAVGTVAACAFAAVLYKVVTGGSVVSALSDLVQSALSTLS